MLRCDVRGLREQIIEGRGDDVGVFFRAEYALNARIAEYPKPIVAIADGVTMGGEKGNVQLKSFDGKFMVERSVSDRIEFDERLQTAKILVDKCLREWTKFSPTEVQALIADAFQVDKKGKINTRRVLGLRKLKIEHPEWQEAMRAISDAITITDTCEYLRFYERDRKSVV